MLQLFAIVLMKFSCKIEKSLFLPTYPEIITAYLHFTVNYVQYRQIVEEKRKKKKTQLRKVQIRNINMIVQ